LKRHSLRLVEKPLLTCALLRGKPLPETAKSANRRCGYAVEKLGAMLLLRSRSSRAETSSPSPSDFRLGAFLALALVKGGKHSGGR